MSKNLETLQTIQQVPDIISGTLDGQDGSYYRINVYNNAGTLLN